MGWLNLFERFYGVAALVNVLLFTGIALYVLFGYAGLPEVVALDFGPRGEARMGPKTHLMVPLTVIMGALAFVVVLVTTFTLKRHTIIERYPYLINIPALAIILGKLPRDQAKPYIDRIFITLPIVAACLAALMAFTTYVIIESAKMERLVVDENLLVAATLSFAVGVGVGTILYFRRIYLQLKSIRL